MDFKHRYTPAQERFQECFREEVASLLDANLPPELSNTACRRPSLEDWPALLRLRRLLGEKGWLHPQAPAEGGGIYATQGEASVLAEELDRRGLAWLQDRVGEALRRSLEPGAASPQAAAFSAPLARGELTVWHTPLDSEAMPGAIEIDICAVEDGDDYVLNGCARFTGIGPRPDLLWTLARLTAAGPAEEQDPGPIACCLVPGGLEGISYPVARRLNDGDPLPVIFEGVRLPRYYLLGEPGDGFEVMSDAFSHAATSPPPLRIDAETEEVLARLLDTAFSSNDQERRETSVQAVMDAYIDSSLARLFALRDYHLQHCVSGTTYHRAQTRLLERRAERRLSEAIHHAAGPYALLDRQDPQAPAEGSFEARARSHSDWNGSYGHWLAGRDAIARNLGLTTPARA